MKKVNNGLVVGLMVAVANSMVGDACGETIVLEGLDTETVTTGDLLDNIDQSGITTGVVEIAGLTLSARSGSNGHTINATSTSLGINGDAVGDDTDAFDPGESLILSFSKDIRIEQIDFNVFDEGEAFALSIDGMEDVIINYDDLDNKSSDLFNTSVIVTANTEMEFYATGSSAIGLDGLSVVVIPEPTVLSLFSVAGLGLLARRRCSRKR